MAEIIQESMAWKDTSELRSKQVLMLAQRVEAHKIQKEVLHNIKDSKEFNIVRRDRQNYGYNRQQKNNGNEKRMVEN